MAINGINNQSVNLTTASASYESITVSAEITTTTASADSGINNAAAVYEKSQDDSAGALKSHKIDYETLDKLKADADARTAQLRGLVEKLLLKQGTTVSKALGLADVYKQLEVDDETRKQAQEDISEDGYWGVEATSDRILSFAQALAGDNVEYAEKMLEAIKEGFKQAGLEWGEDLPEISKQTMDATYEKVNNWIDSLKGNTEASSTGASLSATSTTVKVSATYTKASVSATEASYNSIDVLK